MKNKKGFTIIEIIAVIAIIGIIGVSGTVLVIKGRENSLNKKRNEAFKIFDNALDVYLSNHSEVLTNLEDNVEGAVVTFEVLKNEGLVPDNVLDPETNKVVDYKNNYYVLSDAVMLENEEEASEDVCDGQVSLNVLKSWNTLSDKVNTDDIIYICPKNDSGNNDDNDDNNGDAGLGLDIKYGDILNKYEINYLVTSFTGANPNNYVKLEMNDFTNECKSNSYIQKLNEIENKYWRILPITNTLKLVYPKYITYNNLSVAFTKLGESSSSTNAVAKTKNCIYNTFQKKDYLKKTNYYNSYIPICINHYVGSSVKECELSNSSGILETSNSYNAYIGHLTSDDIYKTISDNLTWIDMTKPIELGKSDTTVVYYFYFINDKRVKASTSADTSVAYYPVVTLNDDVKLKVPDSCDAGKEVGSIDCPYLLTK